MKHFKVLVIRKDSPNEKDFTILEARNVFHARIRYIQQYPPGYINWDSYVFEIVEIPKDEEQSSSN